MHIQIFYTILLSGLLSSSSFSMEYVKALFHMIDKNYIDPVHYITEGKSSTRAQELLLFDPKHADYKEFKLDDELKNKVHEAFEREQKLLSVVKESICTQDSSADLAQIINGIHEGYYSPNIYAIIYGYLDTKLKRAQEDAEKTRKYQIAPQNTEVKTNTADDDELPEILKEAVSNTLTYKFLSPSDLDTSIVKSNTSLASKTANRFRKGVSDPIGHLTKNKSRIVSQEVLCFHPAHPKHKQLNPLDPLHRKLIENSCDREWRLLDAIESALKSNNHATIVTIHEQVEKGYFSAIANAVIAGYLDFASKRKDSDNAIRKEQETTIRKNSSSKTPPASSPISTILPPPPVELPPTPPALGKTPPVAPPKPKMNLSESTRKSLEKTKLDLISANELENDSLCPCGNGKTWEECHKPLKELRNHNRRNRSRFKRQKLFCCSNER